MGQSLKKLAPGSDEKKLKELEPIIEKLYEDNFKDPMSFSDFYRAVCEIVEELNQKLGHTQIKLPTIENLQNEYDEHHGEHRGNKKRALSKPEFQEIMKNLVKHSGFTGVGAKEAILFIFGVPLTALLVKQRLMPQAIPNEYLIPGATSVTVFTLAALNKI